MSLQNHQIMDNNRVVTLANLRQRLEDGHNELELDNNFTIAQWTELLGIVNNVCKITIGDPNDADAEYYVATGFYFGNGWIVTNYHNIFDETFEVHEVTFHFQDFVIQKKKRSFICPDFTNASADVTDTPRKDLALIYIEEGIPQLNQGLHNIDLSDVPDVGIPVCLIHFGVREDGEAIDPDPMQFSVGEITANDEYRDEARTNRLVRHNAYCPPGSSGAPLLTFINDRITVCAVHHAGSDDNRSGAALLCKRFHWIQSTLTAAPEVVQGRSGMYQTIEQTMSWLSDRNVKLREQNMLLCLKREVTRLPENHECNLSNLKII